MESKQWKITFEEKGNISSIVKDFVGEMKMKDASMILRDHLSPSGTSLIDLPPTEPEPTVALLKHYGVIIKSIEAVG